MITFSSSVFADSTQLASVNDSMSCCNTIKVGADWSRDSRKRLALLKAASDPKQCKITTLYQTVMQKVSTVPELEDVLQTAQQQGRGTQFGNISAMLKELILNAEKNASKCRQAIRHQIIVKKFATSMLIYCGPMAYNFLHCNLPNAMPSLRSVQRIVTRNYKTFIEGEFRFDDLLAHLNSFNAPKIVSLSEDATRIIGRIEYDCDSDKLVGFVLPCNDKGIPLCNSFMATTFESIEEAFRTGSVANYAFVYMVQSLASDTPAFCLGCIGSDNKFNAELVVQRWNLFTQECHKRGIIVTSFGADGDSRELRAMQTSSQLCLSARQQKAGMCKINAETLKVPKSWYSNWFAMKNPTSISYVQDIVHLGVKLKSRLLKPSVVLPMGQYLAGAHDLRLVQTLFGKDIHGIRERDVNHKDKQNFDAVLHITSDSACVETS